MDFRLPPTYHILLTVDVEDWFQVENLRRCMPCYSWHSHELRVEKSTHCLLDLLDSERSVSTNPTNPSDSLRERRVRVSQFHQETEKEEKPSKSCKSCLRIMTKPCKSCLTTNSPKATFFVLGWIAERLPRLVREIRARGHEVASHGYYHSHCTHLSRKFLKQDLSGSRRLLEDVTGAKVFGYRAPNFGVDVDLLKVIEECGYFYDSSFNSFALNGRCGSLDVTRNENLGIAAKLSDTFYELPISNLRVGNRILPWGGGGYFRLTPRTLFKAGVRLILKKDKAYLFYMHPWELDPQQPRVDGVSRLSRFRHYTNLNKTKVKLSSFIEAFKQHHFITCYDYLQLLDLESSGWLNPAAMSYETNQIDKSLPLTHWLFRPITRYS